MSFLGKRWVIADRTEPGLIEHLLARRGISAEQAGEFLQPDLARDAFAPSELKNLTKAAERVRAAIRDGERILICGDYDVDGTCGSALLFKVLRHLGGQASVRLPHRILDGYGLNLARIEEAAQLGIGLLITVDNGITNVAEVAAAAERGIDVIVTDHHTAHDPLPPAFAIVNPNQPGDSYPNKNLCGAGVAWKLALELAGNELPAELADEILALAAIATVADIMILTGENRAIVTAGLAALQRIQNPGLQALMKSAGIGPKISAEDIGFRIGPRINAAGRLDSALLAFQVLANPNGAEFAAKLEQLNAARQQLSELITKNAEAQLALENGFESAALIAAGDGWHPGVIGLVAGRLAEKYHRPVVLGEAKDGRITASVRCPHPGVHVTNILSERGDLFEKFGGHAAAAGFTIPAANWEEFRQHFLAGLARELAGLDTAPELAIESDLTESEISFELIDQLEKLQPFGHGNREPIFRLAKIRVTDPRPVGAENKHLQARIGNSGIRAIGFGLGRAAELLADRGTADLAVTVCRETWQGNTRLQLKIIDLE